MTGLCKEMGMIVVAEGVESVEEREALVEIGCDLLQGHLFRDRAKPFLTSVGRKHRLPKDSKCFGASFGGTNH